MLDKRPRLKKQELNKLFLDGLGDRVQTHSNEYSAPLLVDLKPPFSLKLRAYLFNCTNPPGGRALDEYKFQVILPGQVRGKRASLDFSDGRTPILAAYVNEGKDGVFVIWDANKHDDFAYSANMQVKADTIIKAFCSPFARSRRSNNEELIAVRPQYLYDAIKCRIEIMKQEILGGGDQ